MILAPGLVALVVAWMIGAYLVRSDARLRWLDEPNARSLHKHPVPRTGGLAILAGALTGMLLVIGIIGLPEVEVRVWLALTLVAGASLVDDFRGLGVLPRLSVHVLAAVLVAASGLAPGVLSLPGVDWTWPPWFAAGFSILFVVWMTNLYNFMDGMDGFAGGMAAVAFVFMAWLGWWAGAPVYAAFSLCVALAAMGFLRFNFPPARLFMGDTGASSLGFLAAVFVLWADRDGLFPVWVGVLIFSPFIVDATVTLLCRVLRREPVWQAHRSHYYQRLVMLGWGHRRTVLAEYALMLLAGGSALLVVQSRSVWLEVMVLTIWACVYAIIAALVRRIELRP